MSKPTENELTMALQTAVEMKEHGDDDHFMAKALLNHHYRLDYLEAVLKAADLYMNHGMAEHEAMVLRRAIENAKDLDLHTAGESSLRFGLE